MKENLTWLANYYFRNLVLSRKALKFLENINVNPKYKEREVERYTLKQYIEFIGTEAAADLFECKPSTIKAYRYGKRQPSIEQAKIIIKKTGGKLDFESIYGPVEDTKKES